MIKDIKSKDVYDAWQASVMKHLPDFAYITNMVVDRKTSYFLSNQNGVMRDQMLLMIQNEIFNRPGKCVRTI